MAGQQTGTAVTLIRGGTVTIAEAADAFLSSPRAASPNTRRAYAGVLDRLAAELGPGRRLTAVPGDEIADTLRRLWGRCAPATWNRNRATVVSWLTWCARKKRWPAPQLPPDAERRKENADATRALPRVRVERLLSRRDIPLREKTLWRMLYETAARASEILALNVEDLDLGQRRAPIRSKGGDTEFVYWDTGTAHLLPRLLRLPDGTARASGPLFLAARRPVPARRPARRDICPHTGRGRLGYDLRRRLGASSAPSLRGDPPRGPEGPAAADHGQDPAQVPAHRHALRQARRRGCRRGHQPARPARPQPLSRRQLPAFR
jgi:integrase